MVQGESQYIPGGCVPVIVRGVDGVGEWGLFDGLKRGLFDDGGVIRVDDVQSEVLTIFFTLKVSCC